MKKYLEAYLEYITSEIERSDPGKSFAKLKNEHMVQIGFMQHERLIHLIVTCLFAVALVISVSVFSMTCQMAFGLLSVLIIALLAPYIRHYYFLENSVQKMYEIYNRLEELAEKESHSGAESEIVYEKNNL